MRPGQWRLHVDARLTRQWIPHPGHHGRIARPMRYIEQQIDYTFSFVFVCEFYNFAYT